MIWLMGTSVIVQAMDDEEMANGLEGDWIWHFRTLVWNMDSWPDGSVWYEGQGRDRSGETAC